MHTVMILAAGLILLAVFLSVGHLRNGATGRAKSARLFIRFWFVLALVNVTIGVVSAGYSIAQEAPVFLVTFGTPALAAAWLMRRV